jgi:hypothetical protein
MNEDPLLGLLANVRDALHAETREVRSRLVARPGCFSWGRFLRAAKNNDWEPAEQSHLAGCDYCRHVAANATCSLRDLPEAEEGPEHEPTGAERSTSEKRPPEIGAASSVPANAALGRDTIGNSPAT